MWHKENELYFKEVLQTLKKTWETFYDKNSEIERNFFFMIDVLVSQQLVDREREKKVISSFLRSILFLTIFFFN